MTLREKLEACGIVGVVGVENASDVLFEGLLILQSRGYDSVGLATLDEEQHLTLSKYASIETTSECFDKLKVKLPEHHGATIGIGHSRWATHGGITDQNAHPHTDYKNRVAVAHNGTLNNASELRRMLETKHGIKLVSETDTEAIAHLIGLELDKGLDLQQATVNALKQCDGTWAIVVMAKDSPDELVVSAHGSPIVIGIEDNKAYVASEHIAFNRHCNNIVRIGDGETVSVKANTAANAHRIQGTFEVVEKEDVIMSPDPYPHWTLREINEQTEATLRAMGSGGRLRNSRVHLGGMDRNKDRFERVDNLLMTGCGTSLNAALFGKRLMQLLRSIRNVQTEDAAEVLRTSLPDADTGALLAISQSGETKDVVRSVKLAEEQGLLSFSVINNVSSLIARMTGVGVYLNAGRENGVAATKTFVSSVIVMSLLAYWFREVREEREGLKPHPMKAELYEALQRVPIHVGMVSSMAHQRAREIAEIMKDKEHCFVLGKGLAEPIAREGALKIKEISYVHAEAYSGGALKHGPFALIEGEDGKNGATPVIFIILDDEHADLNRIAAEEVKARGGQVFVITDNPHLARGIDPKPLVIPSNSVLTALTAIVPMQLIAYELALLRGVNPDKPRNLAKAVTVD